MKPYLCVFVREFIAEHPKHAEHLTQTIRTAPDGTRYLECECGDVLLVAEKADYAPLRRNRSA